MSKISILVHLTNVDPSKHFFGKWEKIFATEEMYWRWKIKAQNLYGWYWAVRRVTRMILRDPALDVVSSVLSVRKMGNELWQTDPSTGHRLRIQTKTHTAGRVSLTSNPSANWHVELTPIATCQSPFNSDSTEGAKKFIGVCRGMYARIYLHVTCTRVTHACNTCTPVQCREGGGKGGSLPLRQIYAVIIQRVCFRLLLLAGSIY